jgi:hypothetical protein
VQRIASEDGSGTADMPPVTVIVPEFVVPIATRFGTGDAVSNELVSEGTNEMLTGPLINSCQFLQIWSNRTSDIPTGSIRDFPDESRPTRWVVPSGRSHDALDSSR